MRKLILLAVFTPLLSKAQHPVTPILSPDYLSLIKTDTPTTKKDTSISPIQFRLHTPFPTHLNIKTISEKNNTLTILPQNPKSLGIGGNYTFSFATRSPNSTPSLQQQYVQGESANGAPQQRGPETNEPFSYGPVLKETANNNILRSTHPTSNFLSLQANIGPSWRPLWRFNLKAGSTAENTIIANNRNTSQNLALSAQHNNNNLSTTASYSYFSSHFSNDNTNGFLNRVYQDALQTPISFNNAKAPTLITGARQAYSSVADNPWFLLYNNGHFAGRTQQTAHLELRKTSEKLNFGIASSLDAVDANSDQSLPPGTSSFPTGIKYTRKQTDNHYSTDAFTSYWFRYGDSYYSSTIKLNYIFNDEKVNILYPAIAYNYHRSTSDASLTCNSIYNGPYFEAAWNTGNKFYLSNTSGKNKLFLPEISGFVSTATFDRHLSAKLIAAYTSFCSEPAINNSLSSYTLTQLSPQNASRFMPFDEVRTYNDLSPMQHHEFTTRIELDYLYRFSLSADYTQRDTKDNVFPIYENNQLALKNLADTRYKGWEIDLQARTGNAGRHSIWIVNKLSFYKFSNTVTNIRDGYDNHPIAGFSTTYKALVKGQPIGVIIGNSYQKDGGNNLSIGPDGFPLVNNTPSIIGNPTPRYTLKFAHSATWRDITLNFDWEYRNGGDVWNGTSAVLDYYGRSKTTADQRSITGYIFPGTQQTGAKNSTPVDFYNPAQPVTQNRWVRYGYTGVAASYIQKGDNIRIHNLAIAYELKIKKYLQRIKLTAYAENLVLWSAYKGVDPNQLLYDQPGSQGLDFFNLPSTKTLGINVSLQF